MILTKRAQVGHKRIGYPMMIWIEDGKRGIGTEASPIRSMEVGEYRIFLFENPYTGLYHVAEGRSGKIIDWGHTGKEAMDKVRTAILENDEGLSREQVNEAVIRSNGVTVISADDFWKRFKHE